MVPTLFQVAGIEVPTHEFFIALGVLTATSVFVLQARRRRMLSEQTLWIVAGALVSGAIFAKASTAWRFAAGADSLADLWLHGGRSVLGGLAGAYVGVILTKRILGYRRSTGDLFAPAVALGMAIGRIGCFLTEQIGTATSLPWAITLPPEVAARVPACPACLTGEPMHPSFVYEIAFHALAFGVLWTFKDRLVGGGQSFKWYLLAYGLFRFAVEFVRGNPAMAAGLSGSQLFLAATIPLLVVQVMRRQRRAAPRVVPEPA
jgi:phosphatidylglycerol:prolipoprotein diacylglycerol transferase